jgi:hypothetical protein
MCVKQEEKTMIHLAFYVPAEHKEQVKAALFAVGVGKIGLYDHCCFETQGQGQFRPLDGSSPFIGQTQQIETVTEYKIEMVCEDHLWDRALAALKDAHPYETPAFYAIKTINV